MLYYTRPTLPYSTYNIIIWREGYIAMKTRAYIYSKKVVASS